MSWWFELSDNLQNQSSFANMSNVKWQYGSHILGHYKAYLYPENFRMRKAISRLQANYASLLKKTGNLFVVLSFIPGNGSKW